MTARVNWSAMRMAKAKILILGGTGEARELAARAVARFADQALVITSQAGVTSTPEPVAGRLVSGGFGGISGLQSFIEDEDIALVVDATHAFAATISDNAYIACLATRARRITLVRPQWEIPEGARVTEVADMAGAARVLEKLASRVLVTTGRRGLEAFSSLQRIWFLVRLIEMPAQPLALTDYRIITARPPYTVEDERKLLGEYAIDGLLSKQSGGDATFAKIIAAVEADLPIVLIRRPDLVPGDWTASIDDCLDWLQAQL
ncbi:MAG: cobalt-precorrin-6A reductase [Rhodospirillales bacterium]|nr:cobalt-precorrin-6A reductase [Rhodospirillales bacterium]